MIPDAKLREWEALADAAMEGPWVNPDGYCVRREPQEPWRTVCVTWPSGQSVEQGVDDMEFIAEARTAVPALIAEVRRLRGVIKAHDLCHDLHGKVDAEAFAAGCEAEQRRIYGRAPHVDALQEMQQQIDELRREIREGPDPLQPGRIG